MGWKEGQGFVSTALTHRASLYTGTQNSCAFAQRLAQGMQEGTENYSLTVGQGLKTDCIDCHQQPCRELFHGK